MSIEVKQIILHQLYLTDNRDGTEPNMAGNEADSANKQLSTRLRSQLLPVNAEIQQMMLQLHQNYQSKALAYGVFKGESQFARQLNRFLENDLDFLDFSQQSAQNLARELSKYVFADSGTFILCQYTFLATDYLFIALLDSRHSMLVDEELDIQQTSYLNIQQYDIAARLNLTELTLSASSDRYLSFIKGRVGRKVSDFFMDFLGADSGFDPKQQNLTLLQAVDDFCQQGELDSKQIQEVKKQAFDYCKGQLKVGEEIVVTELSDTLPSLNQQNFSQFSQEQAYDLAESFPPLSGALKSLTKYSGSGKGVTLSFDAALLNERIFWNEENDSLTIKGLPANLRDQLQRFAKLQS
ncbi:nucleoid-associated protein [Pasteurella testudinis DSM 23072]|uniref:Nucleoid-associated protein SAMN05660772_00244 n=1 Tax=Pasteurella testudinis DSM 23072 TaxID=1122938 RepID=A0A1W1UCJ5_9PAST|nr:nucleoid-associated protein YejK [Pasteurella testudinis]SMB78816.1 nucleoid-associated protein [Pasteurella testudinis DSM 23072]SUB52479.1 nucleoid-associated protein NdpA [Pasteurella testudinis]